MRPLINDKVSEREDNYSGVYIGKVIQRCDDYGACKVFVPGVYPDEWWNTPDKLPTAYPCMPLFGGGRSDNLNFPNGLYSYPDLNTNVLIIFASNDITKPYMIGQMNHDKMWYSPDRISIHFGKCSIEMDQGGDLYINANNNISIEAENDINITAKNNINIEAYKSMKLTGNKFAGIFGYDVSVCGDKSAHITAPVAKIVTSEGYFGTGDGIGPVTVRSGNPQTGGGATYVGPCIRIMNMDNKSSNPDPFKAKEVKEIEDEMDEERDSYDVDPDSYDESESQSLLN